LDIPTYSDPPENFFEFTQEQFEETWKLEADLFISSSRSFGLFNTEEQNSESDSGISTSFNSPSGLRDTEIGMDLNENVYGVTDEFTDLVSADPLMADTFDLSMDYTPDFEPLVSPDPNFDIFSFVFNEDAKEKTQETSMSPVQLEMGNILGAGASVDILDDIFGITLKSPEVEDSNRENMMEYFKGLQVGHQVLTTMVPTEAEGRNRRKSNPGGPSTRVEEVVFEENMAPKEESVPIKRAPKTRAPKVPRVKKAKATRSKKVIKMHTLDINEHPEAKNAVAARLRRERDNQMKQKLRDEAEEWKTKYFAAEEKLRLAEIEILRLKGGNPFQSKF